MRTPPSFLFPPPCFLAPRPEILIEVLQALHPDERRRHAGQRAHERHGALRVGRQRGEELAHRIAVAAVDGGDVEELELVF